MIRNFITALQFLTIFPVSRKHEITEKNLAKSMVYFPLVGFLLGVFLIYVDKALSLAFPNASANALLLVVFVLATRALHIDGLADTLDAVLANAVDPGIRVAHDDRRVGCDDELRALADELVQTHQHRHLPGRRQRSFRLVEEIEPVAAETVFEQGENDSPCDCS